MAGILDIAVELVVMIAELLHPGDVLPFARSCRQLFIYCTTVISLHQERGRKLRVINDQDPQKLLELLRSMVRQPELGYYVRIFQAEKHRKSFVDWVPLEIRQARSEEDRSMSPDIISYYEKFVDNLYSDDELKEYCRLLTDDLLLSSAEAEYYIGRIRLGDDEVIKVLLVAHCPKLEILKMTADESHSRRPRQMYSFDLLGRLIRNQFSGRGTNQYFKLLQSTRTFVMIQPRDTLDSLHRERLWDRIAPFFLLPKIETVVLDMSYQRSIYRWEWPRGVSTVKELILHGHDSCLDYTFEHLIRGIKALRSLKEVSVHFSREFLINILVKYAKHSLEFLDISKYEYDPDRVSDFSSLQKLTKLRTIHFNICELLLNSYDDDDQNRAKDYSPIEERRRHNNHFKSILPKCIETIKIDGVIDIPIYQNGDEIMVMLQQFIRLKGTEQFPTLQTLCLRWVSWDSHLSWRRGIPLSNQNEELLKLEQIAKEQQVEFHSWLQHNTNQRCAACAQHREEIVSPY